MPQGWIRGSIGIELRYENYHQHVHHLPYGCRVSTGKEILNIKMRRDVPMGGVKVINQISVKLVKI